MQNSLEYSSHSLDGEPDKVLPESTSDQTVWSCFDSFSAMVYEVENKRYISIDTVEALCEKVRELDDLTFQHRIQLIQMVERATSGGTKPPIITNQEILSATQRPVMLDIILNRMTTFGSPDRSVTGAEDGAIKKAASDIREEYEHRIVLLDDAISKCLCVLATDPLLTYRLGGVYETHSDILKRVNKCADHQLKSAEELIDWCLTVTGDFIRAASQDGCLKRLPDAAFASGVPKSPGAAEKTMQDLCAAYLRTVLDLRGLANKIAMEKITSAIGYAGGESVVESLPRLYATANTQLDKLHKYLKALSNATLYMSVPRDAVLTDKEAEESKQAHIVRVVYDCNNK